MKTLRLSIFLLPLLIWSACDEEKHKPLFDGDAPNPVSQYSVENLPGAAEITFTLDDARTAYVKAVYTIEQGVTRESKASKFSDKLIVDGFAQSKEYSITLYAVGHDEQESEPVAVTVHPATPPYQSVLEELSLNADWGGGKLTGLNPTSAQLMVGVVKRDAETKEWVDVDVFFTESPSFDFNFRGQDPVETEFGVYVRDQWQNFSDTTSVVFEPWEEIELPLSSQNFNQIVMPGDAVGQAAYGLRRLFDGIRVAWTDGYYSVASAEWPKTITVDLGQAYQLSRWKYWQNSNLYYQSANAKHIRIWGNNELDENYDNWTLLGEWDNWRPSGRPPLTGNAGLTEEDLEAAQAGNDFDFPLDIPGVRYIRIEAVNTFEPRTQVYYPELQFWGRPTN